MTLNYRKEIDGLRALAVIPVIFFHAGFEVFKKGFIGVDIFFVISGYLITTLIIKNLISNNFSIKFFFERRARRILPALYLVMIVTMPFAWILLSRDELSSYLKSLTATTFFLSNFLFIYAAHQLNVELETILTLHKDINVKSRTLSLLLSIKIKFLFIGSKTFSHKDLLSVKTKILYSSWL